MPSYVKQTKIFTHALKEDIGYGTVASAYGVACLLYPSCWLHLPPRTLTGDWRLLDTPARAWTGPAYYPVQGWHIARLSPSGWITWDWSFLICRGFTQKYGGDSSSGIILLHLSIRKSLYLLTQRYTYMVGQYFSRKSRQIFSSILIMKFLFEDVRLL